MYSSPKKKNSPYSKTEDTAVPATSCSLNIKTTYQLITKTASISQDYFTIKHNSLITKLRTEIIST